MKVHLAIIIAFVALHAAFQSIDDLPSCALPCFVQRKSQTGCSLDDYSCQCTPEHQNLIKGMLPTCLMQKCPNLQDQQHALSVSNGICAEGGPSSSSSSLSDTAPESFRSSAMRLASSIQATRDTETNSGSEVSQPTSSSTGVSTPATSQASTSTTAAGASPPFTTRPTSARSLSSGAIAGIVIGAIIAIVLAVALLVYFLKMRQRIRELSNPQASAGLYGKSELPADATWRYRLRGKFGVRQTGKACEMPAVDEMRARAELEGTVVERKELAAMDTPRVEGEQG